MGSKARPRHPSAGNLSSRPALVREQANAADVPPAAFPVGAEPRPGVVALGPDLDLADADRLLGHIEGKRVLVLGCGTGELALTLSRRGAKVIGVDPSMARIDEVREAADSAEVRLELHHSDLADLAFVRADQVDLAISVYALGATDDLGRVFRQVHRVLRGEAPMLLSLPHPMSLMAAMSTQDASPQLARTAFDRTPVTWSTAETHGAVFVHQVGEVVTTMARSGFRVDLVGEPRPVPNQRSPHWTPMGEWLPTTLVVRGRKIGL